MPSRAGFAFPPAPTVRASGPLLIQLFMAGQGIHSYAKYATSLLRLSGYRGRCLLVSMFLVEKCYVTNAAKHFKWEPRGKGGSIKNRTAGRSPRAALGGRPNLKIIQPRCLVCLDGTAARAVFEREVKVLRERGSIVATAWAERTLITIHPSSLIRLRDPHDKEREFARFAREVARIME